jgi:hypothetical protein
LRGRVGEGGSLACSVEDRFQHRGPISQNVGIPEAKDPIALRLKPAVAHFILLRIGVLPAIEFNDQPALKTDEIDYVSSNRRLPAKTEPVKPMSAKRVP